MRRAKVAERYVSGIRPLHDAPEGFAAYVTRVVGTRDWVVSDRLSQRLKDKGYTVAITWRRYEELERAWEIQTYGAPKERLQDHAPQLLAALEQCERALNYHVQMLHDRRAAFSDPKVYSRPMDLEELALNTYAAAGEALPVARAAIAKARGGAA